LIRRERINFPWQHAYPRRIWLSVAEITYRLAVEDNKAWWESSKWCKDQWTKRKYDRWCLLCVVFSGR